MDSSAQWMIQEFGTSNMGMAAETGDAQKPMEKKVRPQKDQALNCPRCHSANTKFCYYNNYSLTQPRYFCKTCRRYWTQGGTLRNVPVGGGSRKNKKSTSATHPSPIPPHHRLPDLNPPFISHFPTTQNPKLHDQGQDLNLGLIQGTQDYHQQHGIPQFLDLPKIENRDATSSSASANSATNGIAARGLINSFMPIIPHANNAFFAFPFQDCKPGTGFSSDGSRHGNSYPVPQDESNVNGSLMFTFAPNRRNSGTDAQGDDDLGKGPENNNSSNGFGNGMLGGGFW